MIASMTWIAPPIERSDGALDAPERELLRGFLDWHRATLLTKCAGLTGAQLVQHSVPTSNLTLLGLVRHLTKVERTWFRQRVAGQDVPTLYSTAERPDADYDDLDADTAEAAFAAYQDEIAACDAATANSDLDATIERHGAPMSVRCVYLHMIEEYARHNGHADLLREAIDGVTGE